MDSWTGAGTIPDIGTGKCSWFNSVTNPRTRLRSGRGDGNIGVCSGGMGTGGRSGAGFLD